jgi:hypothetical protein
MLVGTANRTWHAGNEALGKYGCLSSVPRFLERLAALARLCQLVYHIGQLLLRCVVRSVRRLTHLPEFVEALGL